MVAIFVHADMMLVISSQLVADICFARMFLLRCGRSSSTNAVQLLYLRSRIECLTAVVLRTYIADRITTPCMLQASACAQCSHFIAPIEHYKDR